MGIYRRNINFAQEIKETLTMKEVVEFYGFDVNRSGFMKCCFHNEKTPSMKIYPDSGGFYCFSCGAHGDVIAFVEKYFNLDFKNAVIKINTDFNLRLPIDEKPSLRQYREAQHRQYERLKQKTEYDKLQDEYHKAFDYWCKLDKALSNPDSPDYIEALKNINMAAYNMEEAEIKLNNYNRE